MNESIGQKIERGNRELARLRARREALIEKSERWQNAWAYAQTLEAPALEDFEVESRFSASGLAPAVRCGDGDGVVCYMTNAVTDKAREQAVRNWRTVRAIGLSGGPVGAGEIERFDHQIDMWQRELDFLQLHAKA